MKRDGFILPLRWAARSPPCVPRAVEVPHLYLNRIVTVGLQYCARGYDGGDLPKLIVQQAFGLAADLKIGDRGARNAHQ